MTDSVFVIGGDGVIPQLCRCAASEEFRQPPGEVLIVTVLGKDQRLKSIQVTDLAFMFLKTIDPGSTIRIGVALRSFHRRDCCSQMIRINSL